MIIKKVAKRLEFTSELPPTPRVSVPYIRVSTRPPASAARERAKEEQSFHMPFVVPTPLGEELVMEYDLEEPTRIMSVEESNRLRALARMRPTAPSLVFKDLPPSRRPEPERCVTMVPPRMPEHVRRPSSPVCKINLVKREAI